MKFALLFKSSQFRGKPLEGELEKALKKELGMTSTLSDEYCRQVRAERDRILEYYYDYLRSIGSAEALRLITDLKKHADIVKNYKKQNSHIIKLNNFDFDLSDLGVNYKVCKNLRKFKNPYAK